MVIENSDSQIRNKLSKVYFRINNIQWLFAVEYLQNRCCCHNRHSGHGLIGVGCGVGRQDYFLVVQQFNP